MKRYNSDQTLIRLTDMLLERLDELNDQTDEIGDPGFVLGSKTAYVECLEAIQATWAQSALIGVPEDIEKKYPI